MQGPSDPRDYAESLCKRQLKSLLLKRRLKVRNGNQVSKQLGVQAQNDYHKIRQLWTTVREASMKSLDCFEEKQDQWDQNIFDELCAMSKEQGIPIHAGGQPVSGPENTDANSKSYEQKFLYDSEDLLLALRGVSQLIRKVENKSCTPQQVCWDYCPLGLETKTREELGKLFPELDVSYQQIGVEYENGVFYRQHEAMGQKLLKVGNTFILRKYIRQGCSPALRPRLYKYILCIEQMTCKTRGMDFMHDDIPNGNNFNTYKGKMAQPALLRKVAKAKQKSTKKTSKKSYKREEDSDNLETVELEPEVPSPPTPEKSITVVDRLHELDLSLIRNNDNFFVFEDLLKNVLPNLFRDHMDYLKIHAKVVSQQSHIRAVPYYGLALQAAPLAYMFQSEENITLCLRELYANYWCQLNIIRNTPVGTSLTLLPNLCAQFESLIQTSCPRLLQHMLSLGVAPLEIAFPWIHLAFAGFLQVEQVLLLWDRILGFDSLLLLPILAAAIFKYREFTILQLANKTQVIELMKETANLKVIAIIQAFLFAPSE
mmetsp:Transcript_17451/g.29822  ORF Transcript_17451/g.29822 Transcript_17451/m.29822 type:complete len:542 (-) Transcript_17451:744-2369(-)